MSKEFFNEPPILLEFTSEDLEKILTLLGKNADAEELYIKIRDQL